VIIDAGGRDSVELRTGLVVAQRVFVPIQASQFDIWTLKSMDDLVETAQTVNPDLQAWVVISRASTNPSVTESSEARELIDDFEHLSLANTVIRDRIAYRKAAQGGRSIAELRPVDPKALDEVKTLFHEVFDDEWHGS
jgi:chromosome partitioning protein